MIDRIGDDMVGRYILEDFINIMSIQRASVDVDAKSGTATILVKQRQGNGLYF